jgi:hypothetical protein
MAATKREPCERGHGNDKDTKDTKTHKDKPEPFFGVYVSLCSP